MRLIDADTLMVELMDSDLDHLQRDDWKEVIQIVADAPTIEPMRKRGKWEITNLGAVGVFVSCSECKRVVKQKAPFYNFCPHCGSYNGGDADEPI